MRLRVTARIFKADVSHRNIGLDNFAVMRKPNSIIIRESLAFADIFSDVRFTLTARIAVRASRNHVVILGKKLYSRSVSLQLDQLCMHYRVRMFKGLITLSIGEIEQPGKGV